MYKSNDSRVTVPAQPRGVHVVPDELLLPLRLRAEGKDPRGAARALSALFTEAQEAITAPLEPARYRSWSEKLVAKSFRGTGVRFHAEALVLLRDSLESEDFFARVERLEELRGRLTPLVGDSLQLGAPQWHVSAPELHRAAAVRAHKKRVRDSCELLGVVVERVDGPQDLIVESVNPVSAYIRLDLALSLKAA